MKRILLTGGSGFVGSNVLSYLNRNNDYIIFAPTRSELDLKQERDVLAYLRDNKFDTVLHFANPSPRRNIIDSINTITEDSLRIFMNLYNHCELFNKMIYAGSGAEYDKSRNIDRASEDDCFKAIPYDSYGFAKMIMNSLASKSKSIYNFRLFGCYGPGEHESRFITHCIRSVILGKDITIRKNCVFDYIHVSDYSRYVEWGVNTNLKYHSYNVSSGKPLQLLDIAKIVIRQMNADVEIKLLSNERSNNYTSRNERIIEESGISPIYDIESGVAKQIEWERANWTDDTRFDGE